MANDSKPQNTYRGYAAQPVNTGTTKANTQQKQIVKPSANKPAKAGDTVTQYTDTATGKNQYVPKDNGGGQNPTYNPPSNYDAEAERLAAEAEMERRRKAAAELKKGIKDVGTDLMNANAGLEAAINWLEKAFTGERANQIKNDLGIMKGEIDNSIDGLNSYYSLADKREKENGGKTGTDDSGLHKSTTAWPNGNNSYTGIYGCDIDILQRDVIPTIRRILGDLDSAETKAKAFSKDVDGLENAGNNVGTQIDQERKGIKETCDVLEEQISASQKAEQENKGIIDRILDWGTGIYNKLTGNDEKEDASKKQNSNGPYASKVVKDPYTAMRDAENAEHYMEILAKQNGVSTDDKTTDEILKDTTVALLAKENGIDTAGKTREEIIREIANKQGIDTTTETTYSTNGQFGEVPLLDQLDYGNVSFGASNIKSGGCGPTSLCMLWSAATGKIHTPEELMKNHPEYGRYYRDGEGCADSLMQNEEALAEMNLNFEGNYYWQEAWGNGKLVEALENGYTAVWRTQNENFTGTGHYLAITGITEDGKILVNDPNGENYMSNNPILVEGFKNGFDPELFSTFGGNFYVYSVKDDTTTTKTSPRDEEDVLEDILKSSSGTPVANLIGELKADIGNRDGKNEKQPVNNSSKTQNNPTPTNIDSSVQPESNEEEPKVVPLVDVKIKQDETGQRLTAPMGLNTDGPSGTETWYDLEMTQVVKNMEELYGFTNIEYKIREDGVKLLSGTTPDGVDFEDLVMVAADVKHSTNPDGTFERGQIVPTSLGLGIVADYCERAVNERKATGNIHFDIATAWWTEPYMSIAYGKEESSETPTTEMSDNSGTVNV